mmetsp:Transcript_19193/g.24882  ORF Transcript_19193/g.24882 Transcript_19193/m.24882 type:complete len:138 (-) Transcript_19193:2343-2756(-)
MLLLQVGRGSEFRSAAKKMGYNDSESTNTVKGDDTKSEDKPPARITIPENSTLSFEDFVQVYQEELTQGKFWGIAHDLHRLNEPLPNIGLFNARYDRIYFSRALQPSAVLDTTSSTACPNSDEPSDHLPVAASFVRK